MAFDIEYVPDGTQYKNYGDDVREGADGPENKIKSIKYFFKGQSPVLEITDNLKNDSNYVYFQLGDETQFPGFGFAKQFDTCENKYDCRCEYSHIYSNLERFKKSYNNKEKTVLYENLNSLFFLWPNDIDLKEAKTKFDSLVVEVVFDDNKRLRKAAAIK